jgi:hypothetical protein
MTSRQTTDKYVDVTRVSTGSICTRHHLTDLCDLFNNLICHHNLSFELKAVWLVIDHSWSSDLDCEVLHLLDQAGVASQQEIHTLPRHNNTPLQTLGSVSALYFYDRSMVLC